MIECQMPRERVVPLASEEAFQLLRRGWSSLLSQTNTCAEYPRLARGTGPLDLADVGAIPKSMRGPDKRREAYEMRGDVVGLARPIAI
jgi:hypothetical protein